MAPWLPEVTILEYRYNQPVFTRGSGAFQAARRTFNSASERSTSSSRFSMSMRIRSPGRSKAIGPPTAASGETCPMQAPWVAPEKRPSVMRETLSFRPRPMMAEVGADAEELEAIYRLTSLATETSAPRSTAVRR